jgi:hypothetical protein
LSKAKNIYREVPEWLKGVAWKAAILQGIVGSNPILSADFLMAFCTLQRAILLSQNFSGLEYGLEMRKELIQNYEKMG